MWGIASLRSLDVSSIHGSHTPQAIETQIRIWSIGYKGLWILNDHGMVKFRYNSPKKTQAHRHRGFLLMPSHLLRKAIRDVELTSWPSLYGLRNLFRVTISALTIRLERLGILYVAIDGQLYPSVQEYHGQRRMAL